VGCEVDHIYPCHEIKAINKLDLGLLAWTLWYDFRGKQVNRMILYMHISPFLLKRKKKVGETSNPSMNICYKQRKTEKIHTKKYYYL